VTTTIQMYLPESKRGCIHHYSTSVIQNIGCVQYNAHSTQHAMYNTICTMYSAHLEVLLSTSTTLNECVSKWPHLDLIGKSIEI
jgi:hypothetical protein